MSDRDTNHVLGTRRTDAGYTACPYCDEWLRQGQAVFIDRETTDQVYCNRGCRDRDALRDGTATAKEETR